MLLQADTYKYKGFVDVFSVPVTLVQFSPASMDPVTATLAVISFATAVKDLVELAQNICDAFSKVEIYIHHLSRTVNNRLLRLRSPLWFVTGAPELQKSKRIGLGYPEDFEGNGGMGRQEQRNP